MMKTKTETTDNLTECMDCGEDVELGEDETPVNTVARCEECAERADGGVATAGDLETLLQVLLEDQLSDAIADDAGAEADSPMTRVRVGSFAARGLMTRDHGLVVRIGDREFQLSIVRSR